MEFPISSVFADFSSLEPHGSEIGRFTLKIISDGVGGYILSGIDQGAD
jgi:hypothetical protein